MRLPSPPREGPRLARAGRGLLFRGTADLIILPAQSCPIAFGIVRARPDQSDSPTDKRPAEDKIDNEDRDPRIVLAAKRDDRRHKVQRNEADNYPEHQQDEPSICLVIHCWIDPGVWALPVRASPA
jgi:hypothetical protein